MASYDYQKPANATGFVLTEPDTPAVDVPVRELYRQVREQGAALDAVISAVGAIRYLLLENWTPDSAEYLDEALKRAEAALQHARA